MESDRDYWLRRAREEFDLADGCANAAVAAIHRCLAASYAMKSLGDPQTAIAKPPVLRLVN